MPNDGKVIRLVAVYPSCAYGERSSVKKLKRWFQNHSIRFKMIVMVFGVVAVLQVLNAFVFTATVSSKFQDNISQANLQTTEQMAFNLNRAMDDIVSGMVSIREEMLSNQFSVVDEGAENNYIARNISYQSRFNQLMSADENYRFIHSMLILNEKDHYSYTRDEYQYLTLTQDSIFQKVVEGNSLRGLCNWSAVVPADYFFAGMEGQLISIIMPIYRYGVIKELLIVNLKVEDIRTYLLKLGDTDCLLLQFDDKDLIYGREGDWEAFSPEEQEAFSAFEGWSPVESREGYVLTSSRLETNRWKLSMLVSQASMNDNAGMLTKYLVVIILTTGIVIVLCLSYIVLIVTKPIQKMIRVMESNRQTRQITYRFHAKYRDEVGVLAETYNKLMDEIQELMADIEREQIQSRKTYQKMLQMQIKPHFLYNTLEAARFLVEMGDPSGPVMLDTIGKFYKTSLSGEDDYTTVAEEIEHLTYYLQILKFRYRSKYDYDIQVAEEIAENEVVRFSLQPLVENAIYHGIKQKREKGFVKVLGYQEENQIHLVVWDNGAGMGKETLEKIRRKLQLSAKKNDADHIGIVNVHQRIRMRYGESYGLSLESELDEFTRVEMILPVKKRMEKSVQAFNCR